MRRLLLALIMAVLGAKAALAEECPYKPNAVSLAQGESLTCTCSSGLTDVAVYGTDVYTLDSFTCTAAMHAGIISKKGGQVTIHAGGACEMFTGSERNGVMSYEYGPYPATFAFVAPFPPCADITRTKPIEDRLARDCAARGETPEICACENAQLIKLHSVPGVEMLYAIYDGVRSSKRGDEAAKKVIEAARKLGFTDKTIGSIGIQVTSDLSNMKPCP